MNDELDDGLAQLASHPRHQGLDDMEARVLAGIVRAGESRMVARGVGLAAAGALVFGLIGGSFMPGPTGGASLDPIAGAGALAPSALLLDAG